jgi:hypothetical protein
VVSTSQVGHVLVPLPGVAAPVADLEVGDPSAAELTRFSEGINNSANGRFGQSADHAGIEQVG